ncbi:MLX-interacting protein-like isoform X2 [Ostrea edulis]|uniref:MLX-interacting protein-like isoform X2 n=1 Tax=Ostrea edulis TaxID=37623 RepID=UPI0024AF9CD4|nr:MLX-interacting protein-like isoform X2 [Ostrea edulis]
MVNGRVKRKTRHRATKSPPDVSSPSSPQSPRTQSGKCGRPANPIPRHKRDSHIKAEYRRRDKIQKGFESLRSLVPSLEDVSEKESKAVMLFKTAEYCRQLKGECRGLTDEAAALRQEIQSLGTQIHDLQTELPVTGVDTVEEPPSTDIDKLYEEYVATQTRKNWKFYLFSFMMRPLFESFKVMITSTTSDEFSQSVNNWVKEKLSLPKLRIEFFNCLRKISKETKIMDEPELLSAEAQWSCAGKATSSLEVKMEADQPVVDQALPVTNSPAPITSHSNMWANSVMTTSCQLATACNFLPQGGTMMSTSILSDNCVLTHNLTDAVMCSDSQDLPLGSLADIPLLTCDTEMSFVDSLLNNLENTDSLHHLLSDQPVSLSDITPTPITEVDITHCQTPFTQSYTLQHNHQNAPYSL